ncbi:hypothetical protein AAGF08_02620 [Algoriphagus sp. SE2]|uniref:hypothetical protein n=1 Tax=Algoriphagus sp. SE2 TaxID=3141536 RepID=UPI0031CD0FCD
MSVRISPFLLLFFIPYFTFDQTRIKPLQIPKRQLDAETGSAFMQRMISLTLEEREEEIYKALASGNIPEFLRKAVRLKSTFKDLLGRSHELIYEVMPDYLAIGNEVDFCRIPMNPHTAQRLADLFGASLITAKISDHIYENATVKVDPFFYKPVGRENESVEKFILHNHQIEKQKSEANGEDGQLIAGIKKDVILSNRLGNSPNKVVIYGWHKLDGVPIQPVYSGHVDWYVDYSHGIRLMNEKVILDGEVVSVLEILSDPILYKLLSNENGPMLQTGYIENVK